MTAIRYPKPKILKELSADRHAVIEASAGTGKTYTLKHLVIELLLSDRAVSLENLLVVTFTRRATADLKRQIRGILNDVLNAFETREDQCKEEKAHWRIDQAKANRLRDAMLGFDRAEIYTIHSFCQKLLTENAFQNHQLFDLELVDEEALFAECFEDMLRESFSTDPELSKWLDAWLMPRVDGDSGNLGDELYAIYKSAGELRQPSSEKSDEERLREAEQGWKDLSKKAQDNQCRYLKTAILQRLMEPVVDELLQRKEREGLYCYSDMLSLVAQNLRGADDGDPSSHAFRDLVRSRYTYALIDEFQDTDPEQWEIFRRLFVDGTGDHRLYIIGDPKQAIYRFRGADVWTYLRAVDELDGRGVLERLGENFRSTPAMVAAYNAILEQDVAPAEPFFTNERINYTQAVDHKPFDPRRVRLTSDHSTPPAITAMKVDEGQSADIKPRWLDWVATEIESILWGNRKLEVDAEQDNDWQPVDAGDIYVLTNSNAEAREVGQMLRKRGVPYAFYRQDGLFQTHEASDILALLRAIADPGPRKHRRAAYRTPFFAVPIRELRDFDEQSRAGQSAHQTLLDWQELAEQRQFTRLFRKILDDSGILRRELLVGDGERALTNYQHLFELVTQRASSSGGDDIQGLIGWLGAQIDGDDEAEGAQEENLQRLETDRPAVQIMTMHKSKGLEAEVVFIYGGFAGGPRSPVTIVDHENPADPNAKRATFVSTAKKFLGDERWARLNQQAKWDSQRLMYVAMTRAKSRLYLCYARKTAKYGHGSRHEALARSLDRIYADNPVPDQIEFIDIGPPGSHPETTPAVEVSREDLLSAPVHLDEFEDALLSEQGQARTWSDIRSSVRKSVSFSGVRATQGDGPIELRVLDDEEATDQGDQNEFDWDAMVRDDRFSAETALLGGGTSPGSFLHDILEHLDDYASVLNYDSANAWLTDDQVRRVFEEQRERHGFGKEVEAYTGRILFDTLRAPVDLPRALTDDVSLDALAEADSFAKEVSFHFPIPEDAPSQVPSLGSSNAFSASQQPEDAPTIKRGWIKGEIDLIFEHDGRIYIADWKSNTRPDYAPRELAPYVDNHYALQAQLYTLAAARLLGITDATQYDTTFGGCAYFFVRGMRPEAAHRGEGIVWCRPSWEELVAWDERLRHEPTKQWKKPISIFTAEIQAGRTA